MRIRVKWLSLTIRINCLFFSSCSHTHPTSTPPLMWLPTIALVTSKFCWCMHPCSTPIILRLLAEDNPQPIILQHAPIFALANYMAWCPEWMVQNTKCLSKKHTQYWTISLGRHNPKWRQLGRLPFQSVPTLYCRDLLAFTIQLVR